MLNDGGGVRSDARLRCAGRFLLVAAGTGAAVGGLTAQLVIGLSGPYAGGAWVVGAMIGMILALAVQAINLMVLGRAGPPSSPLRDCVVPVLLPAVTAGLAVAPFAGRAVAPSLLVHVLPPLMTAAIAWVLMPWCLAPLDVAPDNGPRPE